MTVGLPFDKLHIYLNSIFISALPVELSPSLNRNEHPRYMLLKIITFFHKSFSATVEWFPDRLFSLLYEVALSFWWWRFASASTRWRTWWVSVKGPWAVGGSETRPHPSFTWHLHHILNTWPAPFWSSMPLRHVLPPLHESSMTFDLGCPLWALCDPYDPIIVHLHPLFARMTCACTTPREPWEHLQSKLSSRYRYGGKKVPQVELVNFGVARRCRRHHQSQPPDPSK